MDIYTHILGEWERKRENEVTLASAILFDVNA